MNNFASIMAQGQGENRFAIPVQLAHLGSSEEHVAQLADLRRFGPLRRWDDLLDEGVAAVFGMTDGEAELVGLCFHAGKFTPAESGGSPGMASSPCFLSRTEAGWLPPSSMLH